MRLALIGFLLAGCQPEPKDFDRLPGGGGGGGAGGGTGGGGSDAPTDAVLDALRGRVCLIDDLRQLGACSDTDAGDLSVAIGGNIAVTIADGTFTIENPVGTGLVWRIEDANGRIVPSIAELGVVHIIPAIRTIDYSDLLTDNGFLLSPGQGSVVASTVDGAGPVTNALVGSNPVAQFATRYDGANAQVWDQDATGTFGVAWLAGIATGPATITVTPQVGASVSATLPIEDGAITFATFGL